MRSGPEKSDRVRKFKRDADADPKRSAAAKRETLARKKTRSLKRLSRPGTNPGNAA